MMRYEIRQEQIHGLREALGFHWVDIARMLVLNITRKVHWYSSRCPRTAAKPLKKSFALGIKETLLDAIVHSNLWAGFQSLSETELIKNSCLSSWFKNIHFDLENASLDTWIEIKSYNLDIFKIQVDINCMDLESEFVDLNYKVASLIFCHFWHSIFMTRNSWELKLILTYSKSKLILIVYNWL